MSIEIEILLARKLARWTKDNFPALAACNPPLPPGAFNRLADNWRPLFAIAQVAGGGWPARALAAFTHLSAQQAAPPSPPRPGRGIKGEVSIFLLQSDDIALLAAIRLIFTQSCATRMFSKQLVAALLLLPERRWSNPSIPLTATWLARRLSRFGVHSHNLVIDGTRAKGYKRASFSQAFAALPAEPA